MKQYPVTKAFLDAARKARACRTHEARERNRRVAVATWEVMTATAQAMALVERPDAADLVAKWRD